MSPIKNLTGYAKFVRKIIFPISDIIRGRELTKTLDTLLESQFWSYEKLVNFQENKLQSLIKYAVTYVPYYRDLFRELDLKPESIASQSDLVKLPLLTSDILQKYKIELRKIYL